MKPKYTMFGTCVTCPEGERWKELEDWERNDDDGHIYGECFQCARRRIFQETHDKCTCLRCSKEFYTDKGKQLPLCPTCAARIQHCAFCEGQFEADRKKQFCSSQCANKSAAEVFWYEKVPIIYRETDIAKLPCQSASKFVIGFDMSTSLYIYGKTGTGKTRTVYQLCRRLIEEGEGVMFLRGQAFQGEVVSRTKPGGEGGFDEWIDEVLTVDVLVLDEADKIAFSPRCENEFFNVLESRTANDRRMVFTANNPVGSLIKSAGQSKLGKMETNGLPAVRRIQEFFTPVLFKS